MKKVYLIRHGESEGNISKMYQPLESPLTAKGKEQAEYVTKRVVHLPIEAIVASPLQRAKETAQIVAEKINKTIEFSDLFVERKKPTRLFGLSHDDEVAKKLATEWDKSLFTSGLRAEDGENFDDIKARAISALDFLAKRQEDNILVVTHGFFSRVMTACVLFGESLKGGECKLIESKMRMKNTGLSIFEYNEEVGGLPWQLWVWNDHAHLADA